MSNEWLSPCRLMVSTVPLCVMTLGLNMVVLVKKLSDVPILKKKIVTISCFLFFHIVLSKLTLLAV